eukprot:NODE_49_length_27162_cov_0.380039.p4 type:complete len:627 gc:universal NODE_49_length_27162_cov_0.380039:23229-25109(+)
MLLITAVIFSVISDFVSPRKLNKREKRKAIQISDDLDQFSDTEETYRKEGKKQKMYNNSKYKSVTIMDIQGDRHLSPYENKFVRTQGVVTQVLGLKVWNGFFMQMIPEQQPTGSVRGARSSGIFVKCADKEVEQGEVVEIEGYVFEMHLRHFFEVGESGLTMTSMSAHTIRHLGTSQLVSTDAFTAGMPTSVVYLNNPYKSENVSLSALGLDRGMDYWESLEGMYVRIRNPVVSQAMKYGSIYVYGKDFATNVNQEGGLTLVEEDGVLDMQPESIAIFTKELKRGSLSNFRIGDELKDILGTVIYERGTYGIYVDGTVQLKNRKSHALTKLGNTKNLRIASYNVLNLHFKSKHINKIASHIVNNLKSPSILGLIELVDDIPHSGQSDRLLKYICDYVFDESGVNYGYTYIKPEDQTDGGKPGNNIKQAILYDLDLFEDVPTRGDSLDTCNEEFTVNPCRIDPSNEAFHEARKPLVARLVFRENKKAITVILNHFKSLIGSTPMYGRYQPPVFGSTDRRQRQAKAVVQFISNLSGDVVCMGDFNDLQFSRSYEIVSEALEDVHGWLEDQEKYSYIYTGQSQKLDYMFASESMMEKLQTSGILHLNTIFPEKEQTSDHDPIYAEFAMS